MTSKLSALTFASAKRSKEQNTFANDVIVDIFHQFERVLRLLWHHRLSHARCTWKDEVILAETQRLGATRLLQCTTHVELLRLFIKSHTELRCTSLLWASLWSSQWTHNNTLFFWRRDFVTEDARFFHNLHPTAKLKPNSLKIFRFVICDFSLFFLFLNFSSERRWRFVALPHFYLAPDASRLRIFVWLLLLRKKCFLSISSFSFLMNRTRILR